ncbi:Uncharacterised protein [Mycobacteroides abscessus subsp. abscessus]|nr:Uncharacterised protein [Mycobacteroides abscessus subsp. abscessus]
MSMPPRVVATTSVPVSERAATPALRRSCSASSLSGAPRPTASTLVTPSSAAGAGTRVSSSALPFAPTAPSWSSSSARTSSVSTSPNMSSGAIEGPFSDEVKPITSTSMSGPRVSVRANSGPRERSATAVMGTGYSVGAGACRWRACAGARGGRDWSA